MKTLRLIAAAFSLIAGSSVAGSVLAAECPHSASDYAQVIRLFESEAAKARTLAERNPLLEADVAYYISVLADARACQRAVSPVTTASR